MVIQFNEALRMGTDGQLHQVEVEAKQVKDARVQKRYAFVALLAWTALVYGFAVYGVIAWLKLW